MVENAEETTSADAKTHGVEIIARSVRKSSDQFARVRNHAKMEHAHKRAYASARKAGRESFAINVRTKGDETPQNHNKIEVELLTRNK
jgi:hypothetical protein